MDGHYIQQCYEQNSVGILDNYLHLITRQQNVAIDIVHITGLMNNTHW